MALSLLELNRHIKSVIERQYTSPLWIIAEINNVTEHRSGHCYLELIQKSLTDDTIIAQARATIWNTQYRFLKDYFETVTKSRLSKGIKILVRASIDFHELYGLSLNIREIDPNYSLGDLERRKKEIIQKLTDEGVIDMNKQIELPVVLQNIAVISSNNSAGYGDFINQILNNNYGFRYNIMLFESDMQGANTEKSVVNALNEIFPICEKFDIVVIIRGGGSKSDLSFFDNYNIAYHITQFPIPVFSGIGHDRDDSVTDMVAHTKLKTPTAVANYIIEHSLKFENNITDIYNEIIEQSKSYIKQNEAYITNISIGIYRLKERLQNNIEKCNHQYFRLKNILENIKKSNNQSLELNKSKLKLLVRNLITAEGQRIDDNFGKFKSSKNNYITQHQNKLEYIEQSIKLADPINVLKRGFSISKIGGKTIKDTTSVKKGDVLETVLCNGVIISEVKD